MALPSSSSQRVISTYSAPPSFLTAPDWANIRTAVRSHLPLKNLHWKPLSRPSLRTIQTVDVEFRALEVGGAGEAGSGGPGGGGGGGRESMTPGSFLEKPFLNCYFVTCEDADTYKSTVKKQLKDWLSLVSQRKNQEWIIVLVVKPDPTTGTVKSASPAPTSAAGRLFRGGSVLDKIRGDFNVGKRDRCVQLSRPAFPAPDDPALWMDLISKMKDGIVSSFDANVAQREEETKAMEGLRTMPGWNFCTFFILKESLAYSFEGMNLFEDAMIQYDELEASFFQVLKERNLSWFGKFGGTSPSDDSSSILSVSAKPYRDLILANSISVFDFRIYVFARQCRMLGKMGRGEEVLKKGAEFVRSFGRVLSENQDSLADNFLESWIYSSCMNIIDTCDEWKGSIPLPSSPNPDPVTKTSALATKADLYKLARSQLDKLGLQAGHLPSTYPFNSHLISSWSRRSSLVPPPTSPPDGLKPKPTISRRELVAALGNQEAFDVLFFETTTKAIDCFAGARKERSTMELIGSLAVLDLHRSRLQPSYSRLLALNARLATYPQPSLQSYYLLQLLRVHKLLSLPRDKEWIANVLSLMSRCVGGLKGGWEMEAKDGESEDGVDAANGELREFVDGLRGAGQALEKELPTHAHGVFSIKPQSERALPAGEEDGCAFKMLVSNRLSCTVVVDDVRACLSGRELEQLWFTSGKTELQPGENVVEVFCPMPVSGLFTLETSQVRISRVAFHYSWLPSKPSLTTAPAFSLTPSLPVLRIPKDRNALNAKVLLPLELRLDSQPVILMEITTGRNTVNKASVSLRIPDDELSFDVTEATVLSRDTKVSESDSEALILEGLSPNSVIVLSFPYRGSPSGTGVEVRISIDYWTDKRPNQKRAFRKTRELVLALPLAVNVQDIFREECLFSKFTLSSDGFNHIRIKSASLVGAKSTVDIQTARDVSSPATNVSPRMPASFLFRLLLKEDAAKGLEHDPLRLTVIYRTVADELRETIRNLLHPLIESSDLLDQESWLLKTVVDSIQSVDGWETRFLASGLLEIPEVEDLDLQRVVKGLGLGEKVEGALQVAWRKAVEVVDEYEAPFSGPDLPWRTLEIPVDVPLRQVLSAVRLSISTTGPFSVGQPLTVVMSIDCSSRWSGGGPKPEEILMSYDLGAEFEHWLVSGRKKGTFMSKDDESFSSTFTLIPVHHGSLFLPRVSVQPAPSSSIPQHSIPSSETYLINAAERIEILPLSGRSTFVVGTPTGNGWGGWEGEEVGVEG
ncbi:trafficking protein particle complex subunit 10 [Mrakia frigida]|uniref:transport protein particle complex II subunit TRS130 n=1 Tax=Mrakia frigida TaxID=29902 RepID=UPI003FCC11AE